MAFTVRLLDGTVLQPGAAPRARRRQKQYTVTLRPPPPRAGIRRTRIERAGGQALEARVRRAEVALGKLAVELPVQLGELLQRQERSVRFSILPRLDRMEQSRAELRDMILRMMEMGGLLILIEVVAMPPPGGCARGGGQWAGTHGPPRSVPARRVEEDNGTQ